MKEIDKIDNFLVGEFSRLRDEREKNNSAKLIAAGWKKTLETPYCSFWLPPGETDESKAIKYDVAVFYLNS